MKNSPKKTFINVEKKTRMQKYIDDCNNKYAEQKYVKHSNEACKASGATLVTDENKIKKFIKEGKAPNGTNGVFIEDLD